MFRTVAIGVVSLMVGAFGTFFVLALFGEDAPRKPVVADIPNEVERAQPPDAPANEEALAEPPSTPVQPTPATPTPRIPTEETWILAAERNLPAFTRPEGDGVITGVVQDQFEAPVAGATVTAVPQLDEALSPDRFRDPDAVLKEALLRDRWASVTGVTAVTDEAGTFRFEGLSPEHTYDLATACEGYRFFRWSGLQSNIDVGSNVTLSGHLQVRLRLRAFYPDGTEVLEPSVRYGDPAHMHTGGARRTDGNLHEFALEPGTVWWVEVDHGIWLSEESPVPELSARPLPVQNVTVHLREQDGLFVARIERDPQGCHPERYGISFQPIPADVPITRELAQQTVERDMAYSIGVPHPFYGWEARVEGVQPGRYLLIVIHGTNPFLAVAWREIVIPAGHVGCTIETIPVPGLLREDMLVVHVPNAGEGPPIQVTVAWTGQTDRGANDYRTLETYTLGDDRWGAAIFRNSLERYNVVRFAVSFPNRPWARQFFEFAPGDIPAEVTVRTPSPATPFRLRLLNAPRDWDRMRSSCWLYRLDNPHDRLVRERTAEFACDDLPAGRYGLRVSHQGVRLVDTTIDVTRANETIEVILPPRYQLTVHFPPEITRWARLVCLDENGEFISEQVLTIRENTAVIGNLPAGPYRIRCGSPDEQTMVLTLTGNMEVDFNADE